MATWSPEEFLFQRNPSPNDLDEKFRVFRAADRGTCLMVIWSDDFVGVRTHYWSGRTIPCRKVGCEACDAKRESRWKGYVLAKLNHNGEKVLFEFTPPVGMTLDGEFSARGSLRGLQVRVTRPSGKLNGKVHLMVDGVDPNAHMIAKAPKIVPLLFRVWGMATDDLVEDGGMAAQFVSQAERQEGRPKESRTRRPIKVPSRSLIAPPDGTVHEVPIAELLDVVGRAGIIDQASIARVNGADQRSKK